MYLIKYRLFVGAGRHYAPSARAAIVLLKDIKASGGQLTSITRTRDGAGVTVEELDRLAEKEIWPAEERWLKRGR